MSQEAQKVRCVARIAKWLKDTYVVQVWTGLGWLEMTQDAPLQDIYKFLKDNDTPEEIYIKAIIEILEDGDKSKRFEFYRQYPITTIGSIEV